MDLQAFNCFDPFRHPAWRHQRVLELCSGVPSQEAARNSALYEREVARLPRFSRYDDTLIRRYRAFYLEYTRCHLAGNPLTCYPRDKGLFYATCFNRASDTEWCSLLQARILTRETFEQIAHRFGTVDKTIEWYEALFFNVRDRLDARDWLVKTILGTAIERMAAADGGQTEQQRDLLYKLFGYYGGPHILDLVAHRFLPGSFPQNAREVDEWFDNNFSQIIKMQATSAAVLLQVNKFNVMQLFEIHLNAVKLAADIKASGQRDTADAHLNRMAQALNSIPWQLSVDDKKKRAPLLEHAMDTAEEPRASELFELAAGETTVSNLDETEKTSNLVVLPE